MVCVYMEFNDGERCFKLLGNDERLFYCIELV